MKIKNKILISLLMMIPLTLLFTINNANADKNKNIPPANSYYWDKPQQVELTDQLKVRIYEWNKKNGYVPTNEFKTIARGNKVYFNNFLFLPNVKNNLQVTENNLAKKVLHAPIMITSNFNNYNFKPTNSTLLANYKHAKINDINHKWNYGFREENNSQSLLLFSNLKDVNKYSYLSRKDADAFNKSEGYLTSENYNKKLSDYYAKKETYYNKRIKSVQTKAVKFKNNRQRVLVKKISGTKYFKIRVANKIYYLSDNIAQPFSPYNTYYNYSSTSSKFDPVGKDANNVVIQKNNPYYLYKGEKWFGRHNWIYNGKEWIRTKNLNMNI